MAIGFKGSDEEVDDLTETKKSKPPKKLSANAKSNEKDDKYDSGGNEMLSTRNIVIACIAVAIIIFIIVIGKSMFGGRDSGEVATTPITSDSSNQEVVPIGTTEPTEEPNKYVSGDNNYGESNSNGITARYFDADDYVKDLDGQDVPAVYNVERRDYITAHVSYTAKRAIIDDGMEMYWIDVDYKSKKYRVQVPYYYFKDFEETGICKVNIEILYLEGGGQIISYMQVVDEGYGG